MNKQKNDFWSTALNYSVITIIIGIASIIGASRTATEAVGAAKPTSDIMILKSVEAPMKAEKNAKTVTLNNVIALIKKVKLEHPDIVVAQAIEESGELKAPRFINDNNMFGMKKAGSRPTLAVSYDKHNYAQYTEWKHSVYDYSLYQAAFARGLSREGYFSKLSRTYAGNPEYVSNLKAIIKSHNLKERCY